MPYLTRKNHEFFSEILNMFFSIRIPLIYVAAVRRGIGAASSKTRWESGGTFSIISPDSGAQINQLLQYQSAEN